MYRIRFHGRGGQGMKTASRILGSAFFAAGFEVQDAPRYGAERRGAPIFAYVRADRAPIFERGIITRPDLVLVADETIVPVPAAGVLAGLDDHAVLVIASDMPEEAWRARLRLPGRIIVLPLPEAEDAAERRHEGVRLAAAAARLTGAITLAEVEGAVERELAPLGAATVAENLEHARAAWDLVAAAEGAVSERPASSASDYEAPDWIDLGAEDTAHAAPVIRGEATSLEVRTGLWRVFRPVIDHDHCVKCGICMAYCPDGAITPNAEGFPEVDLEHCKGCMICVAQCPVHTIAAVSEAEARKAEAGEAAAEPAGDGR
ncbi:MAG: 2-oxoacid:acceptor oxidoreductase family protein [Alphaproteobacteria bacterium]|nr:2-oxoacid:acceptor oxidoreductase family protein [Alphaproteobacteria bacterium]